MSSNIIVEVIITKVLIKLETGEVYDLNTQGGDSVWIQWMFLSYITVVCTFCQKYILCHGMPADLFLRGLWKGYMWLVDITLQQPLLYIGCWLGLIFLSKCCGAQFAQTNYGGIQNQSVFLSYHGGLFQWLWLMKADCSWTFYLN